MSAGDPRQGIEPERAAQSEAEMLDNDGRPDDMTISQFVPTPYCERDSEALTDRRILQGLLLSLDLAASL